MIRGIVLGAYQKASSVSTAAEPTESGRFENYDFAMFLGKGLPDCAPAFLGSSNGPRMRSRPKSLNQDPLGQRTGREPIDEALNF